MNAKVRICGATSVIQMTTSDYVRGANYEARMNDTVLKLKLLTITRQQLIRAQLRNENQVGAIVRVATGKLKGSDRQVPQPTRDLYMLVAAEVNPTLGLGVELCKKARRKTEKEIEKYVRQLPCCSWIESEVRGIGPVGLGVLIGMAAGPDGQGLERFKNPSALWKRMGLAVIDGQRQRRIANNPELALRHGYSPERRAFCYLLSESLLKCNKSYYKQVYDERKALEKQKQPTAVPAAHHQRALRFMIKRFLKDLWCVWNGHELERQPTNELTTGVSHDLHRAS